MTPVAATAHIDRETRNAFNELLLMDGLSKLPAGGLLRVLQTIPVQVLEAALTGASRSPCRGGSGFRASSLPRGSR